MPQNCKKKGLQILLQLCKFAKKILKNTFRLELDDMCMYHYVEKMILIEFTKIDCTKAPF